MTPNSQTRGIKWGCKVIWGQRESLEVVKHPSFNSQLWPKSIWTIPKEVFEKIYIKCLQPDGHRLHKCQYSIHGIQGQGGEFIFQADMQGLLMGHLWPRQIGDHDSRVSLFKMGNKMTFTTFISLCLTSRSRHWFIFIFKLFVSYQWTVWDHSKAFWIVTSEICLLIWWKFIWLNKTAACS